MLCTTLFGVSESCQLCRDHAEQVERRGEARLAKLDSELNGYKTNLVQESIRMGHNAIGEHCYERGDLQVGTAMTTKVAALDVTGIAHSGKSQAQVPRDWALVQVQAVQGLQMKPRWCAQAPALALSL